MIPEVNPENTTPQIQNETQVLENNSPQIQSELEVRPVKTHMLMAILSIFGVWPFAVPAIINAKKSKKSLLEGNDDLAITYAKKARNWSLVSFAFLGVVIIILTISYAQTKNAWVGEWKQTAAGLGLDEPVGSQPDLVEIKKGGEVHWYSNINDKTKNYLVGKSEFVIGNKTNDSNQIIYGDKIAYTLTVTVDYIIDEEGNRSESYKGKSIQYLVSVSPDEKTKGFAAYNASGNYRGYKFEKVK